MPLRSLGMGSLLDDSSACSFFAARTVKTVKAVAVRFEET
jgi:hypothetical protein